MVRTFGHEPDPAKQLRLKQGGRLKEARTKFRKLTLEQLATKMSEGGVAVTPQAISLWERGGATPRPHMQVAVCRALDVPHSSIYGLDQEVA